MEGRLPVIGSTPRPGAVQVHNFIVDGQHNYFVTSARVLVHNGRECSWPFAGDKATLEELQKDGGQCKAHAEAILQSMGEGQIVHVRPNPQLAPGAGAIGPVYNEAGELVSSQWTEHYVVRVGDMIYDGLTGKAGMHIDQYMKLFKYGDALLFEP